ncbi:hypothetical protein EVAR_14306_1 [Eumeta japonica]|uniref:Uncharacterized protein n=1 Tax=Eumeta variegata TaxID=151549 RepID=A0A4C1UM26_EUMVA|nr:hypothetical protein EVAR_14306_1 [Eumeta japonica]
MGRPPTMQPSIGAAFPTSSSSDINHHSNVALSRVRECRLRACKNVCGTAQCSSCGDSQARAFVPCVHSGLLHRLHTEPGFCA